jgi:segregation and condensation protein B
MKSGTSWQMVTAESVSKIISEYIKDEVSGELTRPSLEALSIIAYRGPLSKAEIEEIRGVNCSIIIRNLLIRGLIEETKQQKKVVPKYNVTVDFLKYLGIERVSELPEFEKLNSHEILEQILKKS